MKLNIEDLIPPERVKFTLKGQTKDVTLTLQGWNLANRIRILEKFSQEELTEIIEKIKIKELAEIAYVLLSPEDKEIYPDFMSFAELFSTPDHYVSLTKAICGTIGIGEKVLKQLIEEATKKKVTEPKKKPTGVRSSIK